MPMSAVCGHVCDSVPRRSRICDCQGLLLLLRLLLVIILMGAVTADNGHIREAHLCLVLL